MEDKRINQIIRKITIAVALIVILIWFLFKLDKVGMAIGNIIRILHPFLIGVLIALLLGAPVKFFERKLTKKDKNGNDITNRKLAVVLSIGVTLLVIIIVFALVIPQLVNVGQIIANNMPTYTKDVTDLIDNIEKNYPNLNIHGIADQISNNIQNLGNTFKEQLPQILSDSVSTISSTVMGIVNFFIGIGFAVIILIEKEKIKYAVKKVLYTYMKKEKVERIKKVTNIFMESFSNFVVTQNINAFVVGLACVVLGLIAGIPNAVQVGILVGLTSLIPMFGAIIGILISLIIILPISPIKALIFLIISVIVWQLGENIFKPVLIGKKLGMPGILQFVTVIGGGAAFGLLGILLGIPIVNTIYILINERVKKTQVE